MSSKEFSSSTALQSTRIRGRGGGGGLNCEAKAQVLVVTPPPLFFLKVGRKRGGRNSGAVRYMYTVLRNYTYTVAVLRLP